MSRKSTPTDDTLRGGPRAAVESHAEGIGVLFHAEQNPGVQFVGGMRPGIVYTVAPAEAARLVAIKGFEYATHADAERARAITHAREE